jgi:hypothetical protein
MGEGGGGPGCGCWASRYVPGQRIEAATPHAINATAKIVRRKSPPESRVLTTLIQTDGSSKRIDQREVGQSFSTDGNFGLKFLFPKDVWK